MNIFVLIPFDSEFSLVYQDLLKKPLEERNHTVNRADDVSSHQSILKTIIQNISDANLIIADLTTQNPNVYYELGIAHALGKPTIQIVQDLGEVPFDLKAHYIITYSLRFDEAENLQKEILEKIERDEGNEYIFSNPVSEALESRAKIVISAPTSNPMDDNDEPSSSKLESDEDDGEMGTLDAIVEAEESAQIITDVATELTSELEKLGESTRGHTERLNELSQDSNQKGINSRRLQVLRKFANDINGFSGTMDKALPRLDESWTKLDQGLGHYLSTRNIQNDTERDEVCSLVQSMRTSQDTMTRSKGTFEDLRNIVKAQLGLSKVTDRALRNMARTLEKLIDRLDVGDSTFARMIDLATEIVDRYNNSGSIEDSEPA